MFRRACSRTTLAARVVLWHALILSTAAENLNASLFFAGVVYLASLASPAQKDGPLVLICLFYAAVANLLLRCLTPCGLSTLAVVFIASSLRDDSDLQRSGFQMSKILFCILAGLVAFELALRLFVDFLRGFPPPEVPGREEKKIADHAAYNDAELASLEEEYRKGGAR